MPTSEMDYNPLGLEDVEEWNIALDEEVEDVKCMSALGEEEENFMMTSYSLGGSYSNGGDGISRSNPSSSIHLGDIRGAVAAKAATTRTTSEATAATTAVTSSSVSNNNNNNTATISTNAIVRGPSRRTAKKKPKGLPKRPLSSYNIFFQKERVRIYESCSTMNRRVSFEELGKIIGKRWRSVSERDRKLYDQLAEKEVERYRMERKAYEEARRNHIRTSDQDLEVAKKPPPPRSTSNMTTSASSNDNTQHPQRDRYLRFEEVNNRGSNSPSFPSLSPPLLPPSAVPENNNNNSNGGGGGSASSMFYSSSSLPPPPNTHTNHYGSGGGGGHQQQGSSPISYNRPSPTDNMIMYSQTMSNSGQYHHHSTMMAPHQQQQPLLHQNHQLLQPSTAPHFSSNSDSLTPCALAIPAGTDVTLDLNGQEVTYKVQYACYRMTKSEADGYMNQLSDYLSRYGTSRGNQQQGQGPPPHP